jgi:hypothetical protein
MAMRLPALPTNRDNRTRLAALTAVAVAALVVSARAVVNGYATDDPAITANPLLHSLRGLPLSLLSPWWYKTGYLYRPLALFSLGVDQLVGGGAAWPSHMVNVALHVVIAVLVTRLLLRFVPFAAAIGAGLLFALSPVHAEPVASIVGRAELLAALALAGLLLIVTADDPPTIKRRWIVGLLSAAAFASKESGVAAPFIVLAAAWTPPAQRRHAVTWTLSAVVGTVAMLLARVAALGNFAGDLPHPAWRIASVAERISLALTMLPRAVEMLLLPVRPTIDYSPTLAELRHPAPILVVAGVGVAIAVVWMLIRHWRVPTAMTLGVTIAAATLAPTSNLLFASGVVLTGRTLYAPSIGAALVLGAAIAWCAQSNARRLVTPVLALTACVAAFTMWREVAVWHDTPRVLAALGERQPQDYRVPMFAAYAARDSGRGAEALAGFHVVFARFAGDPEVLTDAATVALAQRDSATATMWLREAIALKPSAGRARVRLAGVLRANGDSASARRLLAELMPPVAWTSGGAEGGTRR